VVASRGDDRRDAAVSAVAEHDTTIEALRHGVAGHDDVVAVAGPTAAHRDATAGLAADDDLCVDAAVVILADGGDGLVVHWDEGAVDDPRPGDAGEIGPCIWAGTGTR
jgi:hypothetical protein